MFYLMSYFSSSPVFSLPIILVNPSSFYFLLSKELYSFFVLMEFPFVSVTSALHHCKPFLFSFTVWICLFIVDLTVMQRSIHECSDFVRWWFGQCECFYSYSNFVLFVSVFLICIHVSLTVKLRVPVKRDQIKCNSWNQLKTLFLLNFS